MPNILKVTISQSAIDLYDTTSKGKILITSSEPITSISYTSNAQSSAYLVQDEVNVQEGTLTFKANTNNKSINYSQIGNKGKLCIKFEGFKDETAYNKAVTLKVNKKLPVVNAVAVSDILYPETNANSARIIISDKATGKLLTAQSGYVINAKLPNNYTKTDAAGIQPITVRADKGAKAGVINLSIKHDNWYDTAKISANVRIKIGNKPVVVFGNNTITMNTLYNDEKQYEPINTQMTVKGFTDREIIKYTIKGKNAKSQKLYNNGNLMFEYEKGLLYVMQGKNGLSGNGRYAFTVNVETSDGIKASGTFNVTVVSRNIKASLKAKGSINLPDRRNSQIVFTPSIKNYTGNIVKAISCKTTYKLNVRLVLDTGVTVNVTNVKVKPKLANPKLKSDVTKTVLFESATGVEYGTKINFTTNNSNIKISDVKVQNGEGCFDFALDNDRNGGVLYVTGDTKAAEKKYKLKLAVTFIDGDYERPVTLNITVDLRK